MNDRKFDATFDLVVAAALGTEEAPGDEVNLIEAGLDSLDMVRLMVDLEDEFGGMWPLERLSDHDDLLVVGRLREAARENFT